MNLFARKPLSWIIGCVAALVIAGAMAAGVSLLTVASPAPAAPQTAAPGLHNVLLELPPAAGLPAAIRPQPAPPLTTAAVRTPADAGSIAARTGATAGFTAGAGTTHAAAPSVSGQVAAPASIAIAPAEDWNPVKSQHTLTVTVRDANGAPATGAELELILNRFPQAVGDIVSLAGDRPDKVDNTFGRVTTDASGQAQLTITSTRPGDTDVTAYAPGIADAGAHKAFAVKRWVDMDVTFPDDGVNLVGLDHPLAVRVFRVTDGAPLDDVEVRWSISDDTPDATIDDAARSVSTRTDSDGVAATVLRQTTPEIGNNVVDISVIHAESGAAMFTRAVTKEWVAPSLAVDKSGPASLGLLKTGTYTITVTNSGNTATTGVTLTDELPAGMSFVSSNPAPSQSDGGTVTWSLGNIAPGGSVSVELTVSADAVGNYTNVARAVSVEGFGNRDDATTSVIPGSLAVTKTGPAEVNVNETFTYNVTVTNNGQGALTEVVVTEDLPAAFTFVSSDPAAASDLTWNLGTLTEGESGAIAITATADAAGLHTNSVSVASAEGASASAQAATTVLAPSVGIAKTGSPDAILVGEQATFTLTVTNSGTGAALNVPVSDTLPAGLELVSTNPAAIVGADGALSWTIDRLDANASETFTVTVRATAGGDYTNQAQAGSTGETVTDSSTVSVLAPAVTLEKTGGDGASTMYIAGQRTYHITAANSGEADLTGVIITDTIPGGVSYVSSDNDGSASGGAVTWNVGSLAMGDSVTVSVILQGVTAGDYTNRASVSSDQGASADASFGLTVLAAAGAALDISDNVDPVGVGDTATYTVSLRNQSEDTPITNARLVVTIPDEFEIVSAESGSITGNRVTYPAIATLAAGDSAIYTISVRAISAGDVVAEVTLSYDGFDLSITDQEGTTIINR